MASNTLTTHSRINLVSFLPFRFAHLPSYTNFASKSSNNTTHHTEMFKKLLLLVLFVAPLSLCAQKFAHFDYGTIMQAMPEFKTAQASIEALGKQYQSEIEGMQKELQTKAEKYQKEDTDATPANIKERHQQELQDMYQRLQQAQQDNTEKFQQEQQKKMQPIMQKVMNAVNTVAQEGGYVYIIDKNASQQAGIVINETLSTDVTSVVMKKLGITASATTAAPAAKK